MKTSELIVLTASEMESVQGGIIELPGNEGVPSFTPPSPFAGNPAAHCSYPRARNLRDLGRVYSSAAMAR